MGIGAFCAIAYMKFQSLEKEQEQEQEQQQSIQIQSLEEQEQEQRVNQVQSLYTEDDLLEDYSDLPMKPKLMDRLWFFRKR